VVIDITDYHRLKGEIADFKEYLLSGPRFDDLELERPSDYPRDLEWGSSG
jgi:hypothetical protein